MSEERAKEAQCPPCLGITFTSQPVHQPEALRTQALVADLEVIADMRAAALVVQALIGPCAGRGAQTGHTWASCHSRYFTIFITITTTTLRPVKYSDP